MGADLLLVEDCLHVLVAPVGRPSYDFAFDRLLACRHPWRPDPDIPVLLRVGPLHEDDPHLAWIAEQGLTPLHDDAARRRASQLPGWYPRLRGLTPDSLWGDGLSAEAIGDQLGWPVFVKGLRQTSRHRKSLHIVSGPQEWDVVMAAWAADPILHWQAPVARALLPLRRISDPGADPGRLPSSFEFRVFCWRGEVVGFGPYWWQAPAYRCTPAEASAARALAAEAARRVGVPFLVVDVAQDAEGRWWVVECNDGQESGMAGVSALAVWQNIIRRLR